MRARETRSGLLAVESRNSRRERMRAWRTSRDPMARALERELRQIDTRIEVDFVDPRAALLPPSERAAGVMPARWHIIIRTAPGHDDHWFPIVGPNGSYREPELAIVEEMKARDMWKPRVFDEIMRHEEREEARLRRRELTESEQRVDQVAAAYRAAKRVPGDRGERHRHDRKRSDVKGVVGYAGGVGHPTTGRAA